MRGRYARAKSKDGMRLGRRSSVKTRVKNGTAERSAIVIHSGLHEIERVLDKMALHWCEQAART